MECDGIKDKLSDYIEGVLNSEETSLVSAHIKSCKKCEEACVDLKKTVGYVKDLEEVEPPQWLTQKIMVRVKEEAEKKSLWEKLFYPLHVKLPLEAAATLLVAVTALYILKTTEQEVRVTEITSGVPAEQAVTDRSKNGPAGFAEKNRKADLSTNEKKSLRSTSVPMEVPKSEVVPQPEHDATPRLMKEPATASESSAPPAPEKKAKNMAAGYGGGPGKMEEPQKLLEIRQSMQDTKTSEREMPQRYKAAKPSIAVSRNFFFTINVTDLDKANQAVRQAIPGLGGRIIATVTAPDRTVLTLAVASGKIRELVEKLRTVGELKEKDLPLPTAEGMATVELKIFKTSTDK